MKVQHEATMLSEKKAPQRCADNVMQSFITARDSDTVTFL